MELKIIARIYNGFTEKFGIPRQSGLVEGVYSKIVFEPEYRNESSLTGISDFSHLWLIWQFSESVRENWSPTVRPPRLGGNKRMGVFATRSPFRPNALGLSSVRLIATQKTKNEGTVLIVDGADLKNGTPIYDIKPYLAFTDAHPEAVCGFADGVFENRLTARIDEDLLSQVPENLRESLIKILESDPRPHYHEDGEREYGFTFSGYEVFFKVENGEIRVTKIEK